MAPAHEKSEKGGRGSWGGVGHGMGGGGGGVKERGTFLLNQSQIESLKKKKKNPLNFGLGLNKFYFISYITIH